MYDKCSKALLMCKFLAYRTLAPLETRKITQIFNNMLSLNDTPNYSTILLLADTRWCPTMHYPQTVFVTSHPCSSHKSSQVKSTRVVSQVKSIASCFFQVKSSHIIVQVKSNFFLQVTSSQYGVVYSPFVKWQKYFVNCVVISMTVHKNPKWGGVNHLDIDTSD